MDRARALQVRVGDQVRINQFWNRTEPPARKVPSPTTVMAIHAVGSQTGILLEVQTATGRVKLDAGWFYNE